LEKADIREILMLMLLI